MKNIVCLGDSNTFGYSGDASEKKGRFNQRQRWPCLLSIELGDNYHVFEEGANGRTIQFSDHNQPDSCALDCIEKILTQHSPISLLVIMLGSNDTQERFSASPTQITEGLERLLKLAKSLNVWDSDQRNILIIAPPPMQEGFYHGPFSGLMGKNAVEKSIMLASLYETLSKNENCHYFNANHEKIMTDGINQVDFLHLNLKGHQNLASLLSPMIKNILVTS